MSRRVRSICAELHKIVQNRHVATLDSIRQIQKVAREPLVKEPDAACIAASRFVAIPFSDRFRSDRRKQTFQDCEIKPLLIEGMLDMAAQGCVRIVARRQDLPCAGIDHAMPGTDGH